jgi:hypothetical protein
VRYEDLKADPGRELRRVLDFIGLGAVTDKEITEAVRYASFENMRKMEAEGRFGGEMLKPADHSNAETYKTRKGKIKGYVDYLSAAEVEWLDRRMRENLVEFFGYLEEQSLSTHRT